MKPIRPVAPTLAFALAGLAPATGLEPVRSLLELRRDRTRFRSDIAAGGPYPC